MPPAALFFTAFALLTCAYAPQLPWNVMRLGTSVAMLHGQDLYPAAHEGIVTGHIYPPLSAAFYLLPASLTDVWWATALASALTLLFFALPFWWLARLAVRTGGCPQPEARALVLIALLVAVLDPSLRYAAVMVHAEGPAVTLGLLAIIFGAIGVARDPRALWLSGAFIAAGLWTKQTQVGTALALALVIPLNAGWRGLSRYVGGAAVVSVGLLLALMRFSSLPAFYHNCVWIPAHHPWDSAAFKFAYGAPLVVQTLAEKLRALAHSLASLAPTWWGAWSLAAFAVIRKLTNRGAPPTVLGQVILGSAVAALLQIPLALAGHKKIGGDVNALAITTGPALLLLLAFALQAQIHFRHPALPRSLLAALLVTLVACNAPRFVHLVDHVATARDPYRPMQAFLAEHREQVYLPWNPMLTLRSDGQLYHFEYGVFDRALAGQAMSPEHFAAGLPRQLRYVILPANQPNQSRGTYAHYLPNLERQPSPPGLEDWIVLTRRPDAVPAAGDDAKH